MTEQFRLNISSKVDSKTIREDVINGRRVLVVPSATMPADIVMNGVKYPGEVIKASFGTLDRAPAPCGHPKLNGQYLSARDPEAINHFHVGAWNANVRWDGKRVLLDKIIDVEVAEKSEQGKRLLEAIAKGEPISTSTGLLANVDKAEAGAGYEKVAKEVIFDHDAILLDEEPAAAPEQGVGMLVNGKQVPVVNVSLDEAAERELDWAGQEMMRSVQRAADATLWAKVRDKVLAVIKEGLGLAEQNPTTESNATEDDMSAEELKKLSEQMSTLTTQVNEMDKKKSEEATTLASIAQSLEDLTGKVNGLMGEKAKEDEKVRAANEKLVVDAGLMTAEEAKAADVLVVNALAQKAKAVATTEPAAAPILRGALQVNRSEAPKVEDHFV